MALSPVRIAALWLLIAPVPALAQLPVPVVLEAREGYALPTGAFADADAIVAEGGPSLVIGGRIEATPAFGIFAGYHHTRFGCSGCADRDLDDTIILEGFEGGLRLVTEPRFAGSAAWVQAGGLYQTLAFSAGGDRMTSSASLGFTAAAGLSYRLSPWFELSPGVRYLTVPTSFSFSFAPDLSLDVSGIALDLGVSFRL